MSTFVLVHGAWHGGWCWRKLAPILRGEGHEVFTPTMTGLGERAHLLTPEVGLDTHIQDIVNVLEYEDLREVVLVGHSYAGMVVTGVADRAPERIAHLVFLDAFVPNDGESVFKLRPPNSPTSPTQPYPPDLLAFEVPATNFGVVEPEDVAWLRRHMSPQPRKTLEDGVVLSQPLESRPFSRTYVFAAGTPDAPAFPAFIPYYERLSRDPAWRAHALPTGHDVMVTMPNELAGILLSP